MTYTLKEAEDKMCPEDNQTHTCRGKDCSAWRWQYKETDYGYCGKAGMPIQAVETLFHKLYALALDKIKEWPWKNPNKDK